MPRVIAMILAGGQGSRLSILSETRAKPAVPFGSNYRIIDFSISNVMHSDINYLGIMTQYKPYSLMAHIGAGEAWGFTGRRSIAKVLPPYVGGKESDWYAGTADAIYQNLMFIARFEADTVVILSGDHIYKMLYGDLIDFHVRNDADLTIATQKVPRAEARRFGVLKFDGKGRVEGFQEKPKGRPISSQANLGIYVFKRSVLEERLREDAADPSSSHDFGKDIIPKMIGTNRCFAWEFKSYWRDVGTLQSYWEANMECLNPATGLDLRRWRVQTNYLIVPLHYNMPTHVFRDGAIINSMVGRGSMIHGTVINSVLFRGVEVSKGAEIRDSVILDGVVVGPGARVNRVIVDKGARIGPGARVNIDSENGEPNQAFPHYLSTGLTLIGKLTEVPPDIEIGPNCLLCPNLKAEHFHQGKLPAGSTVSRDGYGQA